MTLMSCDSICCMCGEASSSHWLMTQLTSGQHACVLVFVPMLDTLNIPCDCQLFSLYLMNFMFHTTLDAVGDILKVHYMDCDVSLSQGSVSTLFRWYEHVFHLCVKMFSLLAAVQKLFLKRIKRVFFQSYDYKCTATFFYETLYIRRSRTVTREYKRICTLPKIATVQFITWVCYTRITMTG